MAGPVRIAASLILGLYFEAKLFARGHAGRKGQTLDTVLTICISFAPSFLILSFSNCSTI